MSVTGTDRIPEYFLGHSQDQAVRATKFEEFINNAVGALHAMMDIPKHVP